MAHVGKEYPLAFRRDLGFDLETNQTSWAAAYWVGSQFNSGLIPPTLSPLALVVVEDDPGPNHAVWLSKPTLLAGRHVIARVVIDNTTRDKGLFEARLEIEDQAVGNIAIGIMFPFTIAHYKRINGGSRYGTHVRPDLWQPGGQNNVFLTALNWEQFHAL